MERTAYSFLNTYGEMVCRLLEKESVPYKRYECFDMPDTDEVFIRECQGSWPEWSEMCFIECNLPETRFQEIVDEASERVPLKTIEAGYYNCGYRMEGETPEWIPRHTKIFSGWQSLNGRTEEKEVDCFLLSLLSYNQSRFEELHKGLRLNWALTDKDKIIPEMIKLMNKRHFVLGGGLAFYNRTAGLTMTDPITPGCCGGLEDWHGNVLGMKNERISPWMGHDPYVSLTVIDGDPVICTGDYYDSTDIYFSGDDSDDGVEGGFLIDESGSNRKSELEETVRSADPFVESTSSDWIRFRSDEFDEQLKNVETEFEEFMNGPLKKRIEALFPEYTADFMSSFRYCFDRVDAIDDCSDI